MRQVMPPDQSITTTLEHTETLDTTSPNDMPRTIATPGLKALPLPLPLPSLATMANRKITVRRRGRAREAARALPPRPRRRLLF